MEVQAELDRVATFKGGSINSSILHGSQQRFPIKVGCCRSCCKWRRLPMKFERALGCACMGGTWGQPGLPLLAITVPATAW